MRHRSPAESYRQFRLSAAVLLPVFVVKACRTNLTGVGATSYKSDQLINILETGLLLLLGVYHF